MFEFLKAVQGTTLTGSMLEIPICRGHGLKHLQLRHDRALNPQLIIQSHFSEVFHVYIYTLPGGASHLVSRLVHLSCK